MSALLHLVSRHPADSEDLKTCAATLGAGDVVVLMGAAAAASANLDQWVDAQAGQWYVMAADLAQFGGVSQHPLQTLDAAGLVALSIACSACMSW